MTPLALDKTVLAVDPGNEFTAYVALRGDRKILGFGKIPNHEFLPFFRNRIADGVMEAVACEQIASYGMPVGAEVFETCNLIGRLQEIADGVVPLHLIVRLEVKLAICRSPKANDSAIRTALIDLYGAPGTRKNPGPTYGITKDVWAALALAETYRSGEFRPYVPVALRNKS